jgi:hypothetical protein
MNINNQKGFVNIVLMVVIVVLVGVVGYFAFVKKLEPVAKQPTPAPTQATTPTKTPVSPTQTAKDETAGWKTFTDTQYGFKFEYPATWKATANDNEGPDYKVVARVVNPSRAGKPDTDVPIEQFLVRSQNVTCEGQSINLGGKTGTGRGWEQGFGFIYYRDLCFKTEGWATTILLSAFDGSSQAMMDKILSTFRFTK